MSKGAIGILTQFFSWRLVFQLCVLALAVATPLFGAQGNVTSPPFTFPTTINFPEIPCNPPHPFGDLWTTNIQVQVDAPFVNVPREDDFSMATILPHHIAGSAFTFQSATATAEEGEPPWMGTAPERTVWWRWTPASNQSVRFKAPANGQGLPLEIFTGSTLDNLTRLAHNDGRTAIPGVEAVVPLLVQSGVTYFIRVSDPRPEIPPHPMLPAPNRNNLNLVVESAATPLPGFYCALYRRWDSTP